jgi:hypothetical protein
MRLSIQVLRSRLGPRRFTSIAHTDLPANDFSSLFATIEDDQRGYVLGDPNVFPHAVGRSFYRPTLPGAQVSLGWSAYAAQWLSRIPGTVPGHIIGFQQRRLASGLLRAGEAGLGDFPETALRRIALRRATRHFLPALDEKGAHPAAAVTDAANDAIAEMVSDGHLTPEERSRMCVATYPRTQSETLAPFSSGDMAFGLRLLESRFSPIEDAGWAKYCEDGDVGALAASRAGAARAILGPSLASGLDQNENEIARKAFLDRLEAGMRRRLSIDPSPIVNIVAVLSLAKI